MLEVHLAEHKYPFEDTVEIYDNTENINDAFDASALFENVTFANY